MIHETQAINPSTAFSPRQQLRVLRVIAGAEFKLKYAGSLLGYVWSILKPLGLFTMMYLVFGHIFRLNSISHYYPVSLLIGIVLNTFFADATLITMSSLVARESLLRKLSFPRIVIPVSATLTAAMTFGINCVVIAAFIVWNRVTPRLDWLVIFPLLVELYLYVLGISLILATLFVRLRDIGQVWELCLQLLFYASPVIYPIGFLPQWARQAAFLNPFTQVLQDIRNVVLYSDLAPNRITAQQALHVYGGRMIPIAIALVVFAGGWYFFKRQEPWLAERV